MPNTSPTPSWETATTVFPKVPNTPSQEPSSAAECILQEQVITQVKIFTNLVTDASRRRLTLQRSDYPPLERAVIAMAERHPDMLANTIRYVLENKDDSFEDKADKIGAFLKRHDHSTARIQ